MHSNVFMIEFWNVQRIPVLLETLKWQVTVYINLNSLTLYEVVTCSSVVFLCAFPWWYLPMVISFERLVPAPQSFLSPGHTLAARAFCLLRRSPFLVCLDPVKSPLQS